MSTAMDVEDDVEKVTEGTATILQPKGKVFYNPVQVFNRDISIIAINEFIKLWRAEKKVAESTWRHKFYLRRFKTSDPHPAALSDSPQPAAFDSAITHPGALLPEGKSEIKKHIVFPATYEKYSPSVRILEALSATGLRSIRYAQEIDHVDEIIVNDIDESAVAMIDRNIRYNGLDTNKVRPNLGNANEVMYKAMFGMKNEERGHRFEVVDLDPYGTASIFLDAAVQSVEEGGLLCVTCTDKAVLCGNNPETCYAKYGAASVRAPYCHEMALRLLLASIDQRANVYKRYIVPMMSISVDFYVRVFVRVYSSAAQVKGCFAKKSLLYQCCGCDAFHMQPMGKVTVNGRSIKYTSGNVIPVIQGPCVECNRPFKVAGPLWSDPLHDPSFVRSCLKQAKAPEKKWGSHPKLVGMLSACLEELLDVPLYYSIASLCKTFKTTAPKSSVIQSAILNAGYRISVSHSSPAALKTDMPPHLLMDMMRSLCIKLNTRAPSNEGSIAYVMRQKSPETKYDFTHHEQAGTAKDRLGHGVFIPNPEAHWGPKARANGKRELELAPGESYEHRLALEGQKKKKRKKNNQTANVAT